MIVYTSENPNENIFDNIHLSETAVALGGFDAIHMGHRKIILDTVSFAKQNNLKSVVYMFRNRPSSALSGKNIPAINTFESRLEIIKDLGADIVIAQWFTPEFMNTSAESFFKTYIMHHIGAKYISVGFNYRFGKLGAGSVETLKLYGETYGIKVNKVNCVSIDGEPVSSTKIRSLIADGNMESAAKCLGRSFFIKGKVIRGNQIGRTIGFPTANINLPSDSVAPKLGVYITKTLINGNAYPSITNVGKRPTVNSELPFIETYLSDFDGDLYDSVIKIEFYSYLRDIVKFPGLDALKKQLDTDKQRLTAFFTNKDI